MAKAGGSDRGGMLVYKDHGATELPEDKRDATGARVVDVRGNALERLDFTGLDAATQLKADRNKLSAKSLGLTLQHAPSLVVLSAASNAMKKLPDVSPCHRLGALILHENFIKRLPQFPPISTLNTVVLSHNRLRDVDDETFAQLLGLKKLSLSHNSLKRIPDLSANRRLVELRLNGNRIARVPDTLAANAQLRVLDVGHNRVAEWKHTGPMHEMELHNVTLAGNPLCGVRAAPKTEEERDEEDEEEKAARQQEREAYTGHAQHILPHLRILDGRPVGATAERLQDRKRRVAAKKKRGIPLGESASGYSGGGGGEGAGEGDAGEGDAGEGKGEEEAAASPEPAPRARRRGPSPPPMDVEKEEAALQMRLREEESKKRVSGVVRVSGASGRKRVRPAGSEAEGEGSAGKKAKKRERRDKKDKKDKKEPAPEFDPARLSSADPTSAMGGGFGGGW